LWQRELEKSEGHHYRDGAAHESSRANVPIARRVFVSASGNRTLSPRMRDLTQGSIRGHLVQMSAFLAVGMLVQTLYYLVDLYFVARLGESALAGVSAAATLSFVVMALTQMLGVSAVTLISHAVGRKDWADARRVFHQALLLGVLCSALTVVVGYASVNAFMRSMSNDPATLAHGITYLQWFIPGLALQFTMTVIASALRGTGVVRPSMLVQVFTLALNIVLAPILIAGWGTGRGLGVMGAALATTLSVAAGTVLLAIYHARHSSHVSFHAGSLRVCVATWKRLLNVGIPAGGELLQTFVITWVIYRCLQDFGPVAQAGYGVGVRVLQALFLPMIAIAFAASPIAGQNFGARNAGRVRETFRAASLTISMMMAGLTLVCQGWPDVLIRGMASDPEVIEVGAVYLRITSWNFVALGIVFTCSGLFQAMGNTWPALVSCAARLVLFGLPALWFSAHHGGRIELLWYISVGSITIQALGSLLLLRVEFRRRLRFVAAS
jgi:putative MATE family efflux protein